MKKIMLGSFFALALGLTACSGNNNPFGSSDPLKDQSADVQNGTLKGPPKVPDEKPLGKDVFVIDGEGFADHIILEQNTEREVVLTARSFFDNSMYRLEVTNLKDFTGATVTSTDGDSAQKIPATVKFKWTPTAADVGDQVTVTHLDLMVYTTNLKSVYSYQKSLTVFIYRADYSVPEVVNIQKLANAVREGSTVTFQVDVKDVDGLPTPYQALPTLMIMPKYNYYYNANISAYMSANSATQDPADSTLWHFTVTADLTKAELTDSSVTSEFYIAAKSRFDKVSVPVSGSLKVLTSLSQAVSSAKSQITFAKGANNHYEFQVFDPKEEGIVTFSQPLDCSGLPGAVCTCEKKNNNNSIMQCSIDWNPPANFFGSAYLNYTASTQNTDKSDTQVVSSPFNLQIIVQ